MSFELEIVTPERTLYAGTVSRVRAPGSYGGFGVLTGHHPMASALRPGLLIFNEDGGLERRASISGGFAEVLQNRVTILAETAKKNTTERAPQLWLTRQQSNIQRTGLPPEIQRGLHRVK